MGGGGFRVHQVPGRLQGEGEAPLRLLQAVLRLLQGELRLPELLGVRLALPGGLQGLLRQLQALFGDPHAEPRLLVAAVGGHRLGLEACPGLAVGELGPPEGDLGPLHPVRHLPEGEGGEDEGEGEALGRLGEACADRLRLAGVAVAEVVPLDVQGEGAAWARVDLRAARR